jgi:hypothetical protein
LIAAASATTATVITIMAKTTPIMPTDFFC